MIWIPFHITQVQHSILTCFTEHRTRPPEFYQLLKKSTTWKFNPHIHIVQLQLSTLTSWAFRGNATWNNCRSFRDWMHLFRALHLWLQHFQMHDFVGLLFLFQMVVAVILAMKEHCLFQTKATSTYCTFHHTGHIPCSSWTYHSSYHWNLHWIKINYLGRV